MKLYIQLFTAFFRSGMLGFGGGPSSIPLVHKEIVGVYKWMNDGEFAEVLALGNSLPGPINTKMAGYIGYRIGGFFGMLVALSASILPTVFLMLILLNFFNEIKDNPRVQGMTHAVVPIVGVMMGVLTWSFIKKANKELGWKLAFILFVGSILLMEVANLHPGLLIGILLLGVLVMPEKKKQEKKTVEGNRDNR